jgi:hypothetical protein
MDNSLNKSIIQSCLLNVLTHFVRQISESYQMINKTAYVPQCMHCKGILFKTFSQ